jgi:hypothetical protein
MIEIFEKIFDKKNKNRDILIDGLCDEVESGSLNVGIQSEVVDNLILLISKEKDISVMESAFNLLSLISGNGVRVVDILNIAKLKVNDSPPSVMAHANDIISNYSEPASSE